MAVLCPVAVLGTFPYFRFKQFAGGIVHRDVVNMIPVWRVSMSVVRDLWLLLMHSLSWTVTQPQLVISARHAA